MKVFEGKVKGSGKKVCIVVSKFNEYITQRLLDGCVDELVKKGVKKTDIQVSWVPGALEIPVVALKFAKKKNVHAVICLGAVIRGETKHFDLVAQGTTQGIVEVAVKTGKPIIFEVLATDTVELANKRSQEKGCNKGRDAAIAAIETADLLSQIK